MLCACIYHHLMSSSESPKLHLHFRPLALSAFDSSLWLSNRYFKPIMSKSECLFFTPQFPLPTSSPSQLRWDQKFETPLGEVVTENNGTECMRSFTERKGEITFNDQEKRKEETEEWPEILVGRCPQNVMPQKARTCFRESLVVSVSAEVK